VTASALGGGSRGCGRDDEEMAFEAGAPAKMMIRLREGAYALSGICDEVGSIS